VTTPSPEDLEDIECFTDFLTCNSLSGLHDIFVHDNEAHVPDFFRTERVKGRMRFEAFGTHVSKPKRGPDDSTPSSTWPPSQSHAPTPP